MKETDYLIVGAGAMGIAFADEIFHKNKKAKLTLVDRRLSPGGHWNDAYPFVRLHQPAAFYGVNSRVLGNGTTDLSSKPEILEYYQKVLDKLKQSGRVEFLSEHNFIGEGRVASIHQSDKVIKYKVNKRLVDATYMKVEVPSTHAPKYEVEEGVPIIPINDLVEAFDKWENFYVVGNGKTGMDAVLFLLNKGTAQEKIHWICPNQAWLFHREKLQVGNVASVVLRQLDKLRTTKNVKEFFLAVEGAGGIMRIDQNKHPKKWRCATVSDKEANQLREVKNLIEKGRVLKLTADEIQLQHGTIAYAGKSLFVDCSANALSREKETPIFSEGKITLQPILFCQQVFSAATIARMELTNLSDEKKNRLKPIAHPEFQEDWPYALSASVENLLILHRCFPLWMFRSRLNFMSHETLAKYLFYSIKAAYYAASASKRARQLDEMKAV